MWQQKLNLQRNIIISIAALTQTYLVGCSSGAAVLSQLQHGPIALAAGGTVEAVRPVVVDPLVVAEVPGQAEGFAAQVTHVALLPVDSHVVAQGHVVGVGLAAKVAPERRKRRGF